MITKLFSTKKTTVTVMDADWHPILYGHCKSGTVRLLDEHAVSSFICEHGLTEGNLLITRDDGTPFISTFGIFLDKISDMDYREKLLKVLVPMQRNVEATALSEF